MAPIVQVHNLVYEYPGKRALHGLTFAIEAGWVVAVVGPNGAGKTTLLRCLSALEEPFSGHVIVDGLDTQEEPRLIHRLVGYLPDFYGLYDELTVRRCLRHLAAIHEIPDGRIDKAVDEVIADVELQQYAETKAGALSRGLRQRLAIGQAIIHRPKLLILDEPAAGLDPEARVALSKLIQKLQGQGITLMVSSHILSELEDYSTHMLTIRDGRVLGLEPIEGAASAATTGSFPAGRRLSILLAQSLTAIPPELENFAGVSDLALHDSGVQISLRFNGSILQQSDLLATLVRTGVPLYEVRADEISMQDVYLRQIRSAGKSEGSHG